MPPPLPLLGAQSPYPQSVADSTNAVHVVKPMEAVTDTHPLPSNVVWLLGR